MSTYRVTAKAFVNDRPIGHAYIRVRHVTEDGARKTVARRTLARLREWYPEADSREVEIISSEVLTT